MCLESSERKTELHYVTKLRKRGGFIMSFLDKLRITFCKENNRKAQRGSKQGSIKIRSLLKNCG